jgi:hypothetical protein
MASNPTRDEILRRLDPAREFQNYGGQVAAGAQPSSTGWLPVFSIDRIENHPSASLNVGSDPSQRGIYVDHAPTGKVTKGFFDLIAQLPGSPFMRWNEVYRHYGRETGVFKNGSSSNKKNSQPKWKIFATYDYHDAAGNLVFQTVRMQPKDFRQRQPDGAGGWIWSLAGIETVLYHLPELLPAALIYICEGEKDSDRLRALGVTATCNPMGANKWRKNYNRHLQAKAVVILPDNDLAGKTHGQDVAQNLHGIAANVRVIELPGLPEKGDVSDWLDAGGTLEQLRVLVEAAPEWAPATAPPDGSSNVPAGESPKSSLPHIVITHRALSDLSDECFAALVTANTPPSIFVRGGCLVRVVIDEKKTPKIAMHTETSLRGRLARTADFKRETDEGRVPTFPPPAVVKDLLAWGEWPLPALVSIIESPVIREDGTILEIPGYDPATGLYYTKPDDLLVPEISDEPTTEEIERAKYYLEELIHDFPFKDLADKANALGLLITPIVRPAIRGAIPMALVDAPTPGTGKTLFTDIVSITATGKNAPVAGIPKDDEEMRKFLTSTLLVGNSLGCFDNIDHPIWSPSLCRMLTATTWEDRILGKSETVKLPQLTTWISNGNNIKLRGDLPRRCFPIHFDSGMSKPWERTKFKHPRLREWALSYRGDFIAAILTIARAWFVASCPKPGADLTVLGGFEAWTAMIGGILGFIGAEGFLTNLKDFHEKADLEGPEWEGFLSAWLEFMGPEPTTCKETARVLREKGEFAATLPDNLGNILNDPEKSFEKSLGNALNRKENRPYGEKNLAFYRDSKTARAIRWKVISR